MKTIILTSVFAVLFSSANLNAKSVKTYINMESSDRGTLKEYISIDEKNSTPLTKELYTYDANNNIVEKKISKWNERTGWTFCNKYEYSYMKDGKVANITYTKWDQTKQSWASKSDLLIHLYDNEGDFISIEQQELDNSSKINLMSQK